MPRRKMEEKFPKLSGKYFGKRLRELRTSKNISVNALAVQIGVLESYIPQLERGEKLPSFETLIYIANALGVTTDELLCDYVDADRTTIPNNIHKKLEQVDKKKQRHLEKLIDMEIAFMTEG